MKIKDTLLTILVFIKHISIIRAEFFISLYSIVLLIPSLALATEYYGTNWGADGLANTIIGKYPGRQADYRFRAEYTGSVTQLRIYLMYAPEYGGGTGGKLTITLETDDGTVNHLPSGTVLTSVTDNDPMRYGGNGYQPLYTFSSPINLTKGKLYHLRFTNTDVDPINNYISINELWVNSGGTYDRMPTGNIADLAHMRKEGFYPWVVTTDHTPIFTLYYFDGRMPGQGYIGASVRTPRDINGPSYKVRSNITVSGASKTINIVWVRLKKVSGKDDLTVRLEDSGGTLIEEGTVSASSIKNTMTWVSVTFLTTHTLNSGSTYHIVLSTGSGTTYQTYPLQDGSGGYDYVPMFSDGHFEYATGGSTWTDATTSDFKAQIYISDQTVSVTGITVSGTGGSNTITTDKGTLQLISSVLPSNATNNTVTWSIANGTGQASINSSGLVIAITNGTITARATATDGSGVYGTLVITISNQVIPANPVHVSSAVENTTPLILEMTYNLTLANVIPAASSFAVMVNSVPRNVNTVAISGTKVLLTLASAVVYGDVVTIDYNKPATNPLQTASGAEAASIAPQSVTNNVSFINTPPVVVINSSPSNLSGFVGEIDATGSYDPNNDNLSYTWIVPDNIPVSSTNSSTIQFLSPIVNAPQTVEFTLKISDGKTTQSKIVPVEILPYKPELEVAEILNVEASSFQSPNYPHNILDGNIGTMWAADGDNQWLILELKGSFKIQHIKLAFQLGQRRESYFDILGSEDKVTWEPILTKSSSCAFSGDIQVFDFPPSKTGKEFNYVKLVGRCNSLDAWNYISEFRIFGYKHRNLSSYKEQLIKIYPNPAHKFINIKIDEPTLEPDFIRIINISGKVVFQDKVKPDFKELQIPINLIQGVYIVQMGSGDLTLFTQKLIIGK